MADDHHALEPVWSANRLAEFLGAVAPSRDVDSAFQAAVDCAAESFDAEVAVIIDHGRVEASVGLVGGAAAAFEAALAAGAGSFDLDGFGAIEFSVAPFHDGRRQLAVGRSGAPADASEVGLLRCMARVLDLSLRTLERQRLFEQLSTIQRSISHRDELDNVLHAITSGLQVLLDEDLAMLRLVDPDDPGVHRLVASAGLPDDLRRGVMRLPLGSGAGGLAIVSSDLVAIEGEVGDRFSGPMRSWGLTATMAAPVTESGRVVGALVVGSRRPGRTFSDLEREMLCAFAEHASLALNDAEALEGYRRAHHDPLTGLANRRLLVDRLEEAAAGDDTGDPSAVLFVDLDRFKSINDSLGHAVGDELLVHVASRLLGCVRPTDTVARLGGDEFAVLLPGGAPVAEVVATRILEQLRLPIDIGGREIVVSASIGVAIHGDTIASPLDLLHEADVAMYQAKQDGRNRHEVFHSALGERARQRLDLQLALRRALSEGDLSLHYQPLVDVTTERIVSFEALLRWEDPSRPPATIADVVALAEETGMIVQLGTWVLREACAQIARWRADLPGREVVVHVNVSGRQLIEPGFADLVGHVLRDFSVDPSSLRIEITESVLVGDRGPAIEALRALSSLGVLLSLDDFGRGYSSLAYLTRIQLASLKIDRDFVCQSGAAHEPRAIIRHVVALAHELGMEVIAEGVETDDQARQLRELGCDQIQGYLYHRPMPATDARRVLDQGDGLAPADAA